MAAAQERALHDYRNEMSAKRQRFRELRGAERHAHELLRAKRSKPFPRFELTDEQRDVLAKWRADVAPHHMPGASHSVDDPTSEDREPDLRRFERGGDLALS